MLPTDAHDAQLSNGPIGASIRVREVPIQQCHLTAHSFGVESQAVVAVEVGIYPGGYGYAVGLTRR